MKLSNIENEKVFQSIDNVVLSKNLFKDYEAFEHKVKTVKSPINIIQYDSIYTNKNIDRWMFFRIEEYSKNLKLRIDVNKLLIKDAANLNIENYFLKNYNDKKISKRIYFNINSLEEFDTYLNDFFDYIIKNMDKKLERILKGDLWEKQEFDWGDYK